MSDSATEECENPDWSDNCNGVLRTEKAQKKGLCEGCMAVIRSWDSDESVKQTESTEQSTLVTDGGTTQKLGPVEDYFPHYVDEEEVEFDYAFYRCRCGWESDPVGHPSTTEAKADLHWDYGHTPDCGVGKHVIVFEDGSVAEI